jgi:hypothetical protein
MSVQSVQIISILNSLNGCSKSGVQIYPLKGVYIFEHPHCLIHDRSTRRFEHLNIEQLRTPADTNSAYGLWHPGKESFCLVG